MPPRDQPGQTAWESSTRDTTESLSPRPIKRNGLNPLMLVWLLVPLALLWLNWPRLTNLESGKPVLPSHSETPVSTPPVPHINPPATVAQPSRPALTRPLDECLNGGSTIDESVLRCRFGDLPRPKPSQQAPQGMVSAAYLARYKADVAARPARNQADAATRVESHVIRSWDGGASYLATWTVSDNRIDYSSVCLNQRKGSIEYRECRKGAKQWFKEQCAMQKGDASQALKQRYCSAASGFGPMG